jgi:predicted ATP-grasp superfamily ATP-dependent carboligase
LRRPTQDKPFNRSKPVRALLVDQSRDRATLVAVRNLAAAGFTVATGACKPSFASTSRHAGAHHVVHECEEDEDRFVADIAAAVAAGGYDIVFCSYDVGLLTLSRRRAEIGGALWPYAPYAVVERAFDKLALTQAAQAAGLGAPHTEPATAEALEAWTGPVVVKARTHVPKRFDTGLFPSNGTQARELVHQIREAGGEPLLQEPIAGGMGAVVVMVGHDGELISEIHQEATRTWPPDAGDTVRGRIIAPERELSRGVHALVRDLGWFGLAQIEFVRDGDGVPRITDFNGRFYGSLALATGAGVNLPALWAEHALGRGGAPARAPRGGAGFQWLNRDLAAAYADGPRALLGALAAAPLASHSMWEPRDPSPTVRYLIPEGLRRLRARLGSH